MTRNKKNGLIRIPVFVVPNGHRAARKKPGSTGIL